MEWTPQQDAGLKAVNAWMKDPFGPQVFRLFGYAGTGKTSMAKELAKNYKSQFAAFTGKAALVLRKRGCHGAQTIHSLIYTFDFKNSTPSNPKFVLDPNSLAADADLIIIDEVSMVNEEIGKDLLSFGTRVLVLGDPFQLPPVKGTGYFTNQEPDHMLTEIHRQALENPIVHMSMVVREGDYLNYGTFGDSKIIRAGQLSMDDVNNADIILTGKNDTRRAFNKRVRKNRGIDESDLPIIGDRVICLKNNKEKNILNGQIFNVLNMRNENTRWVMHIDPEDDPMRGLDTHVYTHEAFYTQEVDEWDWKQKTKFDEFDFGYAITVHKSQGSGFDDVLLIDQSSVFRDYSAEWLYTGLTRAAEKITLVM